MCIYKYIHKFIYIWTFIHIYFYKHIHIYRHSDPYKETFFIDTGSDRCRRDACTLLESSTDDSNAYLNVQRDHSRKVHINMCVYVCIYIYVNIYI
jgi:hypothetical protein